MNKEKIEKLLSEISPWPWVLYSDEHSTEIQDKERNTKSPVIPWTGFDGCNKYYKEVRANAQFIAQAPQIISDLLAENKQQEKDIEEELTNRDNAEECINRMYEYVMGESPEWSNLFGYMDALNVVEAKIAELDKQWISVEDELPEPDKTYYVEFINTVGCPMICAARLVEIKRSANPDSQKDKKWYVFPSGGHELKKVTRWSYILPPAPKEG